MISAWQAGIAAALVAVSIAAGYKAGTHVTTAAWDRERLQQAQAAAERERQHRATEREWAQSMRLALEWHEAEREKLRDEYENAIADVESGANRLRNDLRGCRADRVPGDTASPGVSDEAGEPGLSKARQRVALRIGADCDAVAVQLNALQRWVEGLRR